MFIYYVNFALILGLGLFQYYKYPDNRAVKIAYLAITGAFLIFISGWRFGIGYDYYAYFNIYEDIANCSWNQLLIERVDVGASEPGFRVFTKLLTYISTDAQFLYIVTSFMMVGVVLVMVYRYSKIPFISMFLFVTLNYFYSGMNLLRYTMAGIICFCGYRFLMKSKMDYKKENRKIKVILHDLLTNFLPYALIVLLAASMHKSALIMLPLYFIVKIDLNLITGSIYAVLTILFVAVSQSATRFLSEAFFNGNYNPGETQAIYVEPAGTYYIFIPVVLIIIVVLLRKKLLERDQADIVLINMCVYSFVVYFIAAVSIYIMTRVAFFPYIFMLILVPEMIDTISVSPEKKRRMKEIDEEIKTANKNMKVKLVRERADLKSEISDGIAFSSFGIGLCLVLCFVFSSFHMSKGSHKVFPYYSLFDPVNTFTRLDFNNDREVAKEHLLAMDWLDRYLFEANDPDYVLIISAKNESFNGFRPWHLEQYRNMGLNADFLGRENWSYVAVVDGGEAVYEELSQQSIEAEVSAAGLQIELSSDGSSETPNSSILIDDVEHSVNSSGLNMVVYDKVLGEVVDEVNFQTTNYFRDTMPPLRVGD